MSEKNFVILLTNMDISKLPQTEIHATMSRFLIHSSICCGLRSKFGVEGLQELVSSILWRHL